MKNKAGEIFAGSVCILLIVVIVYALFVIITSNRSDEERIDKIDIHGEECMVIRNRVGKATAIDCNWEKN